MKKKQKTIVTKSTKSVVPEHEKRLMAMICGEEPRNESEAKLKKEIEEIKRKGYIIEIPS